MDQSPDRTADAIRVVGPRVQQYYTASLGEVGHQEDLLEVTQPAELVSSDMAVAVPQERPLSSLSVQEQFEFLQAGLQAMPRGLARGSPEWWRALPRVTVRIQGIQYQAPSLPIVGTDKTVARGRAASLGLFVKQDITRRVGKGATEDHLQLPVVVDQLPLDQSKSSEPPIGASTPVAGENKEESGQVVHTSSSTGHMTPLNTDCSATVGGGVPPVYVQMTGGSFSLRTTLPPKDLKKVKAAMESDESEETLYDTPHGPLGTQVSSSSPGRDVGEVEPSPDDMDRWEDADEEAELGRARSQGREEAAHSTSLSDVAGEADSTQPAPQPVQGTQDTGDEEELSSTPAAPVPETTGSGDFSPSVPSGDPLLSQSASGSITPLLQPNYEISSKYSGWSFSPSSVGSDVAYQASCDLMSGEVFIPLSRNSSPSPTGEVTFPLHPGDFSPGQQAAEEATPAASELPAVDQQSILPQPLPSQLSSPGVGTVCSEINLATIIQRFHTRSATQVPQDVQERERDKEYVANLMLEAWPLVEAKRRKISPAEVNMLTSLYLSGILVSTVRPKRTTNSRLGRACSPGHGQLGRTTWVTCWQLTESWQKGPSLCLNQFSIS